MKKKRILFIVIKLLDSYKVLQHHLKKKSLDPCGEVSWNWVLRCFLVFFQCRKTTITFSPPFRPLLRAVHPSSIHPSLSPLTALSLSSIRSGTSSSSPVFFFLAFIFYLLFSYFFFSVFSVCTLPPSPSTSKK